MARVNAIAVILAPFMVAVAPAHLYAQEIGPSTFGTRAQSEFSLSASAGAGTITSDPFAFSASDLRSIQYSRVDEEESASVRFADRQTEFSLSVKPARPKFSLKKGFGLNMIGEAQSRLDVESGLLGPNRLVDGIPHLHDGLAYSAGLKVEHEDEDIDGTAYVSSGQLGISYGRLGRLWYGGLDVNLEQFVNEFSRAEQPNVITVDFTTGRRLGWTGTSSASPLWLLSITGNLDVDDGHGEDANSEKSDWYLNPSLFWQNPGFTFSAQVQLPVETPSADGELPPDYRLRAVFEKHFQ